MVKSLRSHQILDPGSPPPRSFTEKEAELARQRRGMRGSPDKADELQAVKQQQSELRSQRRLALERLDAAPRRIVPGKPKFLAHALVIPPPGGGDTDAFDARVEEIAMRIASEWERGRGAVVTDVSKPAGARMAGLADYPGFDLVAVEEGGRKRHIEVKGRAGRGEVWMEGNEWKSACHLGEAYWLYVVYGCATSAPRLMRVQDPFSKLVGKGVARLRISAGEVAGAAETV